MKLVVGLGNPGKAYHGTRHNIGFRVVDALAARHQVEWQSAPRGIEALIGRWRTSDVLLGKPLTFMNASGPAVGGLLQFYKIDIADALVVVDEISLELGRLRARPAGSAGGHNGLKSIIGALGSEEFPRLRVGVGRGDARRDLADHVLAAFAPDEQTVVDEMVDRSVAAAELFVSEGIASVMNRFNAKDAMRSVADSQQTEDRD